MQWFLGVTGKLDDPRPFLFCAVAEGGKRMKDEGGSMKGSMVVDSLRLGRTGGCRPGRLGKGCYANLVTCASSRAGGTEKHIHATQQHQWWRISVEGAGGLHNSFERQELWVLSEAW